MNRIGHGEPYLLSEEEELKLIDEINISLFDYEKTLTSNDPKNIPYEIVISASKNSMNMVKLYSKKEGWDNDNIHSLKIFQKIELPENLMENFHIIQMLRVGITHRRTFGNQLKPFLINFKEFIKGFNDFYSEKYLVPKPFRIESLYSYLNFIIETYDLEDRKKATEALNTILEDDELFTEDYEKLKISEINNLIKTLEEEIKNIENDSYYYGILLHGQKISESMLILYLEKNGYIKDYKKFLQGTQYKTKINAKIDYKNFMQILNYCMETKILPDNVIKFLRTMQKYRNEGIHGAKPDYDLIKTYLETLNYFLIWFNEFYSQNLSIKNLFRINEISLLIQSLSKDDLINDYFLKLDAESKNLENQLKELNKEINPLKLKLNKSNKIKYARNLDGNVSSFPSDYERDIGLANKNLGNELETIEKRLDEVKSKQSELETKKIMKALEIIGKNQEIINKKIDELSETTQRIEDKIDKILNTIDTKMDAFLSFISDQISNAASKEEIEKLITGFTNQYIEKISPEYYNNISKKGEYEKEKKKLIYTSLGEDAWGKLSDNSKTFLITSKVMYGDLLMVEDLSDYSGVCILVAKALEVEMFNRFYTDFIEYLKGKYGDNYEKYPSSLIHTNRNKIKSIVFEKNFYMGTVVYLLSPKKDKYNKKSQIKHDEEVLLEYCKNCIFSNKNEKEIIYTLEKYAEDIETIKDKYRNPSAHRNAIQRINAEECFELVLDYEKLLKKMLDSFKY